MGNQESNQQGGAHPQGAAAAPVKTYQTTRICFHSKHGDNVSLFNGKRTAERGRPNDMYSHGIVITDRYLKPGELFQIRLDKRVKKWMGNMHIGITTEEPADLDFPDAMRNAIDQYSGEVTIMWDGSTLESPTDNEMYYGDLKNDDFQEGTILGIKCTSNKELHFYINGRDLGVAATGIPPKVRGVVDMYGNVCKVSIVDSGRSLLYPAKKNVASADATLLFHSRTGQNAEILNNNKTARRTTNDFNRGTLMTNRPLRSGEYIEVVIEKILDVWSGAVELGVTCHRPETIDYPATLTDITDKTWCLSGSNVFKDGSVLVESYAGNTDPLRVGDRAGLMVRNGDLHFYVNGVDKGLASSNIPDGVYGIVDMYGSTSQISLVDNAKASPAASAKGATGGARAAQGQRATQGQPSSFDLTFHSRSGDSVAVFNNNRTAKRDTTKFNYGVLFSHRALEPNELFEVVLQEKTQHWSGMLEIGVTTSDPDDKTFELPSTMSLMEEGTWILVGATIMHKLHAIKENYGCGMDDVKVNDRVGVMLKDSGELHFFYNGQDMGCAAKDLPPDMFAVVDLYGRAAQVSVVDRKIGAPQRNVPVQRDSATFTTVEGIDITLKSGNLIDERVDVIVNTTGKAMKLDVGNISRAVLAAAGPQIQTEVNKKVPKGAKDSEVVQSSGGKMTWLKAIYHGSVAGYDGGRGLKTLEDFIYNILNLAHKNNMRSLSMPAIGTGVLGFPPEVVAEVMVENVTKFSQNHGSSTSLRDIRVVLYSGDTKTIQGFEQYISGNMDINDTEAPTEHARTFQISIPDDWKAMKAYQQCLLVNLKSDSNEYKMVEHRFIDKGGPRTVQKIERIQSMNMYMLYMTQKRIIEGRFDKKKFKVAENTLYHGTNVDVVDSINKNGFNRSYCGKNATRFGEGVYFAVQASYSAYRTYSPPDAQGLRRIYQCKVLTGEYTNGDSSYKAPPCKDKTKPNELFDTVVDDVNAPAMYVTFHDASAYPEYLISFT